MLILTIGLLLVGMASRAWFSRRYPNPSREQTVAVVASLVGSILMMARPTNHGTAWFYIGAVIATIAVTFLLERARRRFT
jgi:hypothetical protein